MLMRQASNATPLPSIFKSKNKYTHELAKSTHDTDKMKETRAEQNRERTPDVKQADQSQPVWNVEEEKKT